MEIETQLELARRFRFLPEETVTELTAQAEEVARLVNGLMNAIEKARSMPS